jgi:hypothetical protein
MFLGRMYKRNKNPQRGIAIFDKSISELTIQRLSHIFTTTGHQWGKRLNNFFEYKDSRYFSIIQNCFDTDGKDIHGLHILV